MTYDERMVNLEELAVRLKRYSVEDVAREAQVSTKTIYRLRNLAIKPNTATVLSILDALKRVKRLPRKAA